MILDIKTYPNKILTKKAKPIGRIDAEIKKLIDDMAETMYAGKGVGLAANQVGIANQIIVVDAGDGLRVFINPKITKKKGKEIGPEGCLSLLGGELKIDIKRPAKIEVKYLDKNGQPQKLKFRDFLARVICHEIDHLQGKTILDRVGWWKRLKLKRQLRKIK